MSKKVETTSQKQKRERDHQMVKGIFKNLEMPGGSLKFPFRRYKEDGVKWYDFKHDQEYEIPFMVYEHLNKGCFNVRDQLPTSGSATGVLLFDANGNRIAQNTKPEHRFAFIQTSFKNIRDFQAEAQ